MTTERAQSPRRWRIPSPEQAFRTFVDRLPPWLGDAVWNATIVVAWITLPLWFVGVVSDLDYLQPLGRWLAMHAWPPVQTALVAIANAVRVWRGFVEPFHAWVQSVLPFPLPKELTELLVALLPAIPSFVRLYMVRRSLRLAQRQSAEQFADYMERSVVASDLSSDAKDTALRWAAEIRRRGALDDEAIGALREAHVRNVAKLVDRAILELDLADDEKDGLLEWVEQVRQRGTLDADSWGVMFHLLNTLEPTDSNENTERTRSIALAALRTATAKVREYRALDLAIVASCLVIVAVVLSLVELIFR